MRYGLYSWGRINYAEKNLYVDWSYRTNYLEKVTRITTL